MGVSLIASCAECGAEHEIDSPHDCPMSLVHDFRERWDRAFFAALTGLSGIDALSGDSTVHHAQSIANETIRRHADMMASRDAVIVEVVG